MIQKTIIPTKTNVELSLVVPENFIGEEIEVIAFIKNKELPFDNSNSIMYSVKGNALSNTEFRNWKKQAESLPIVSLNVIENEWTSKRMQLQKLIK